MEPPPPSRLRRWALTAAVHLTGIAVSLVALSQTALLLVFSSPLALFDPFEDCALNVLELPEKQVVAGSHHGVTTCDVVDPVTGAVLVVVLLQSSWWPRAVAGVLALGAFAVLAKIIGRQINEDFKGETVVLVGILRGAVMWMTELMKHLTIDVEIDFMACSSYGSSTKSSGVVKINKDLESDISGKNVIIVENIVDSGTTLDYLKGYLAHRGPKTNHSHLSQIHSPKQTAES